MKKAWVLALLVAACGAETEAGETLERGEGLLTDGMNPTKEQSEEVAALPAQGAGENLRARFGQTGALGLLDGRGPVLASSPTELTEATGRFVAQHPALFAGAEVQALSTREDEEGFTVVPMQQVEQGLPVYGSALVFRVDSSGRLVHYTGKTFAGRQPMPGAVLSEPQVMAIALAEAAAELGQAPAQLSPPEIQAVAFPVPEGFRPAFHIALELQSADGRIAPEYLVDAVTGQVLLSGDRDQTLAARVNGRGVLGDLQPLDVDFSDQVYALADAGRKIFTYEAYGFTLPGSVVTSNDGSHWDEQPRSGAGRGAAVDAHAYLAQVFDYFQSVHGRKGISAERRDVLATVHYGQRFNNAFWTGQQLVFGDGDGRTLLALSGALDVVAHEYTHALTQAEAQLSYQGETGALNESISDAFASFVETRAGKKAWLIGEAVYTPGSPSDALRDMVHPGRFGQPDHTRKYKRLPIDRAHDMGGVHLNSGIPNNAFYLMAMGGKNDTSNRSAPGIGVPKAEKVVYRAITHYLSPASDFQDMARACLKSTQELYGASEVAGVQAAWEAVGVLPRQATHSSPAEVAGREREPNNTRAKAQNIALDSALSGALSSKTDRDWFKVVLSEDAALSVELSELGADIDLALYDGRGRVVERSQSHGTQDEKIAGEAKAGTYYIKVYASSKGGGPGGYRLNVRG